MCNGASQTTRKKNLKNHWTLFMLAQGPTFLFSSLLSTVGRASPGVWASSHLDYNLGSMFWDVGLQLAFRRLLQASFSGPLLLFSGKHS
jgi:hypothetical protein